jgi:hypothetical protein
MGRTVRLGLAHGFPRWSLIKLGARPLAWVELPVSKEVTEHKEGRSRRPVRLRKLEMSIESGFLLQGSVFWQSAVVDVHYH